MFWGCLRRLDRLLWELGVVACEARVRHCLLIEAARPGEEWASGLLSFWGVAVLEARSSAAP